MKFAYKARTKEGELQIGNVDASNRDGALGILLGHGLFILTLEPVAEERWFDRVLSFFRRVKASDMMIFTRQFATLLASQVPLSDSLANLYRQTQHATLKEIIAEISNDVDAGFSLSQALDRHVSTFSEFYVNMVKSAEVTGRLSEVLNFLADYLEKQTALVAKVKNALIYPALVIGLFIVVVIIMVSVVLPQITPIFAEANIELPFFTQILLSVGTFIANWWWGIGILFGIFLLVLIDYSQTKEGKVVFDEISLRLPVMGPLFQKLYVARFSESTRMLIKGGLTIPQAIEISSHTIGNAVYRDRLHEASDKIRKGELLSRTLETMSEFPPLVSQLIAVGESTGRLEQLLEKVTDFYSREVDDMVNNLVTLIQPILMIVIGVMVALLFASILLPLYNLSRAF
ncbi:MAG: Tfp pilus biogenesis protein PilC [Candidatus Jorgensenbacteria bacterium GW2011_GWA1_48_13]|uniref:Tfp pilus biogenesis protein PilC n=2 Tax=Candidatus Joergenseniibacteriota TaxID=1752739 RepID=A0A0G1Z8L3_9BACT|nr:MAG: Tfp pilus biogenesis protein PilC [Candidatus Jorgensenbacteria bacterium GW2011_GWA1_48_13]KKU98782.1 MAG: Type II secretion system F domain protein [Candidatus Jorgensenbacteria bacterium GW2011_GWC1_48_8]KKW15369.1 MAG: Tfp pilus biogenesis protein PilC [Candidatus Jorgensenbacteria bacterium GW2011_GWB1_50_10]